MAAAPALRTERPPRRRASYQEESPCAGKTGESRKIKRNTRKGTFVMEKRSRGKNSRQGYVEVEAVVILPLAVLSTLLLLYVSLFLFQRANLQACLETALVYYKNAVTDTYVSRDERLLYTKGEDSYMGAGGSYSAEEPLSPYRNMFGDGNDFNSLKSFEAYFRSVAGDMLFNEDLTLTIDYDNYVYLKQFEVTATQKVSAPIDFHALGIGNEYMISAAARVAVVDHDGMIRDVDYAVDLIEDTKLGEAARTLASRVTEAYGKLKEFFGL